MSRVTSISILNNIEIGSVFWSEFSSFFIQKEKFSTERNRFQQTYLHIHDINLGLKLLRMNNYWSW